MNKLMGLRGWINDAAHPISQNLFNASNTRAPAQDFSNDSLEKLTMTSWLRPSWLFHRIHILLDILSFACCWPGGRLRLLGCLRLLRCRRNQWMQRNMQLSRWLWLQTLSRLPWSLNGESCLRHRFAEAHRLQETASFPETGRNVI